MIFCRDWWPWTKPGYINMTQRQSNNQCSSAIVDYPARPPKIQITKSAGKVLARLDFLGSRRHPSQWLPSKGPNYQRGVLLISAGETEGHFKGQTLSEGHQWGLVLARQCPGSPGTCNP
jgi:hypothetical protein